MASLGHDIKVRLREYPDFPEPGVLFQDLSSVFGDPALMRRVAAAVASAFSGEFSHVVAVEARGFLIGSSLSQATGLPLVLARKAGKLLDRWTGSSTASNTGRRRWRCSRAGSAPETGP
jgi:adenine phosphoribosyltransferase